MRTLIRLVAPFVVGAVMTSMALLWYAETIGDALVRTGARLQAAAGVAPLATREEVDAVAEEATVRTLMAFRVHGKPQKGR